MFFPARAWDTTMTIDRRTLEGIEACRPGSDDLQSDELADVARRVQDDPQARAVYARVQQWDAAVSSAMEQVPVPVGLAERILARLSASGSGSGPSGAVADALAQTAGAAPDAGPRPGESAPRDLGRSRRRWLTGAAAVAATVAVAVFLAQYVSTTSDTPLEAMADAWLAQLKPKWRGMSQAPNEFAMPRAIRVEAVGWQNVGQFAGAHGAAYQLVHATAGTARLFVVRLSKGGAPATPPSVPQFTTGGRSIGYWQTGKLLYVLVVNGNEHQYRAFVNPARMPLAWNPPVFRRCPSDSGRLVRTIGKIA